MNWLIRFSSVESRFRKIIKALGESGYNYEVIEFMEDGTFKIGQVQASKTHMRVDNNEIYEVANGGDRLFWKLITEEDFRKFKSEWDEVRDEKGYPLLDDNGKPVEPAMSSAS